MKKIFNVMLMLVLFSAQALAKATTENTLSVWMDQKVELTADGKTVTRLTVYEYDPNINYLAFNMALSVPKGVKVYQRKEGRKYVNDITLNPDRTYDHTISCGMPNDFTIKIMGYSLTNSELFPDNEDGEIVKELFSIGLIADDTAINGTYKVEMWDVNFSILDEDKQHAKGYGIDHIEYSDFTITGGQDFPGIDYTMTSVGYGTIILPFNCEIPKGLTVLECNGIDNNNVLMLNSVNSFAANTPYIVKGGSCHIPFQWCVQCYLRRILYRLYDWSICRQEGACELIRVARPERGRPRFLSCLRFTRDNYACLPLLA